MEIPAQIPAFKTRQSIKNKKAGCFVSTRLFFVFLGWMMGLEPTTTEATTQ